jgi:hypothetical protein
MISPDTFLIELYVSVDDFCKHHALTEAEQTIWSCGRARSLTRSEVVTLSIFGQWGRFRSEREFWSFCEQRLRPLFPGLPNRSEFVRAQQRFEPTAAAYALYLAGLLKAGEALFEVIDRCGLATRMCGRRGRDWLGGYANKGLCGRLGFFWGLQLMCATTRDGVITGYGFAPGSAKDQPMAEALFAARHQKDPRMPTAGTGARPKIYLVDKGFSGPRRVKSWRERYGVTVIGAPQRGHGEPWSARDERWLARLRQIVETVHDRLLNFFRLGRERPHTIGGFRARLAAKVGLHNFCIWLNRKLGRPSLKFADLLGW